MHLICICCTYILLRVCRYACMLVCIYLAIFVHVTYAQVQICMLRYYVRICMHTMVSYTLEATSQILARVVALLSCMRYHDSTRG